MRHIFIIVVLAFISGCQSSQSFMRETAYESFENYLEEKQKRYEKPLPVDSSIPPLYATFKAIEASPLNLSGDAKTEYLKQKRAFVYFQLLIHGEEFYTKLNYAAWKLLLNIKELRASLQEMISPLQASINKEAILHHLDLVISLLDKRIVDLQMIVYVCTQMIDFAYQHRD